ncbi:MAG: ATP-binding protein [Gemmatimonadaceae bacterium]|nr:ATP-binding protein [Gemmatimonadaceae bacterium]
MEVNVVVSASSRTVLYLARFACISALDPTVCSDVVAHAETRTARTGSRTKVEARISNPLL